MAGKTYAILGGGGSFGIHAAFYLLDHANPKKVIGIGRNPLRPEPFSLGIEKREGYQYHARHVTYELDLLLELLDKEKPQVIVNFAAQGEGAVSWKHSWRFFETNSMALASGDYEFVALRFDGSNFRVGVSIAECGHRDRAGHKAVRAGNDDLRDVGGVLIIDRSAA